MMINEIVIYCDYCPKYKDIENLFVQILDISSKDLMIEYIMMDDWAFKNEKQVPYIDIGYLNNKIYNIEVYEHEESKGVMFLEKNRNYQINMYIRKNIFHEVSTHLIENIKAVFQSFQFIAMGEDVYLADEKPIKDIVLSSSGVELWIYPYDNNKQINQKVKLLKEQHNNALI